MRVYTVYPHAITTIWSMAETRAKCCIIKLPSSLIFRPKDKFSGWRDLFLAKLSILPLWCYIPSLHQAASQLRSCNNPGALIQFPKLPEWGHVLKSQKLGDIMELSPLENYSVFRWDQVEEEKRRNQLVPGKPHIIYALSLFSCHSLNINHSPFRFKDQITLHERDRQLGVSTP